jgi:hypothetical protein
LEFDSQAIDNGWLPAFETATKQFFWDAGYTITEYARRGMITIADDEHRKLYQRDLNQQRAEKNTTWKVGWEGLSEADAKLLEEALSMDNVNNIKNPVASKAFHEARMAYQDQLKLTRQIQKSGYTDTQKAESRDQLSYKRNEFMYQIKNVKALEKNEAAVAKFSSRIRKVGAAFKDAKVDIDESKLFASDDASFAKFERWGERLAAIDARLKDEGSATGIKSFEERIAEMKERLRISSLSQLEAIQQYGRNMSSATSELARVQESIGLDFDKEATLRIDEGSARFLANKMNVIEQLKTRLDSGLDLKEAMADFIWPSSVDDELKKRLMSSKAAMLDFIASLSKDVRDATLANFKPVDYAKYMAASTGIAGGGAFDNATTRGVVINARENIKSAADARDA